MIRKIIAGLMLTGVCYGWITQSDIAVNNLLQYSPSVRTGDMLIMTRPGVAGTATGWTYTTNGWQVDRLIVTSNAVFPSSTGIVTQSVTAVSNLTVNGSVVSNITQTVTDSATDIPSGAAVSGALGEKVSVTNGTATNLTVYDALNVRSSVQSIPAVISGNDAGDFAGTYTYAGSSELFGNYYTNANGKFLYYDLNYESFGSWELGNSVGIPTFFFDGGSWSDTNYDVVDIVTGKQIGRAHV